MTEQKPRRKRRYLWILLFLVGIPVLIMVSLGSIVGTLLSPEVTVEPGSVLEINLSGGLSEGPSVEILAELMGEKKGSVWGLRRAIRSAAEDENIVAIRLLIGPTLLGWGCAEEIVSEIDRFRESGKPVYVLLRSDMIGDLEYFLATTGDRIWVSPETGVLVNGLASEVTFWRDTLEKLKIEPEVIMFKEYKSAGEMFQNREMSSHMREALTEVLRDFDARFHERVTDRREIEWDALSEFMAKGMSTAGDLLDLALVDEVGYLDEVEEAFEELPDVEEYESVGLGDYLRSCKSGPEDATETLAVVFGEGPIVARESKDGVFGAGNWMLGPVVAKNIRKAAEDEDVKAILFRVDSPGGSAVGSDVILREIDRARENGKPVVVSMSSVAGSGGYWISMHADGIVAQPTTITGSIGVVFTKFNMTGFMDWIGANVDTVSTAPMADIFGTAPLDPERRARVEAWMEDLYDSFKEKVAEGRDLPLEKVEEIARGRIWTGQDALELGLVDRLGGMEEAIDLAKELAGLDPDVEYPLVVFPKPKPFLQQVLEGDLFIDTPAIPTEAEILEFARETAQPRVLARMPDIRIY